jgi:hypothetical protein
LSRWPGPAPDDQGADDATSGRRRHARGGCRLRDTPAGQAPHRGRARVHPAADRRSTHSRRVGRVRVEAVRRPCRPCGRLHRDRRDRTRIQTGLTDEYAAASWLDHLYARRRMRARTGYRSERESRSGIGSLISISTSVRPLTRSISNVPARSPRAIVNVHSPCRNLVSTTVQPSRWNASS